MTTNNSLSDNIANWRNIDANEQVLDWIENGDLLKGKIPHLKNLRKAGLKKKKKKKKRFFLGLIFPN